MNVLYLIFFFITVSCEWVDVLDPQGNMRYEQLIDSYKFINDKTIWKRDENSTLDALVVNLYNSGLITDVLYEISSDDTQISTLVNLTTNLLNGETVNFDNFDISLNFTAIMDAVLESKLIQSAATYLLMNDTNNKILADTLGGQLVRNVWVGQILNNLGAGQDLTIDMLANTIKNTPNLNPKYNSSASKQIVLNLRDAILLDERDDNNGSASEFLNNLVNGVLQSSLVSTSLNSVVNSISRTGIAGPLIMDVLQNTTITSMIPKLVVGLYNNGVLNFDTNKYYQDAKKTGILSDGLQWLLTNPTWEPPLARLLHRMENNGVYKDLEDGLFGPN